MPGKPKKKATPRQTALSTIIQKIDRLRAEMQSGNDQLRSEMQTGFKEVNARIDNVEAKLTSLDEYTRSNILTFGRTINEITGEISKMINNARKRAQIALDEARQKQTVKSRGRAMKLSAWNPRSIS